MSNDDDSQVIDAPAKLVTVPGLMSLTMKQRKIRCTHSLVVRCFEPLKVCPVTHDHVEGKTVWICMHLV